MSKALNPLDKLLKEKELNHPGIYKMIDKDQIIIYIGKAKNLKNRLSNYKLPINSKIKQMMLNVFLIETKETKDEFEALILEDKLIKLYKPKYNILLKDNKSNTYIHINKKDQFPKISIIREKNINSTNKKDEILIGPFLNRSNLIKIITFIKKTFKIRDCSDYLFKSRTRPCVEFQIQNCTAPCVEIVSEESYKNQIEDFYNFLTKDKNNFTKEQKIKMQKFAIEMKFEEANKIKQILIDIEKINNTEISKYKNTDIILLKEENKNLFIMIFVIRGNILLDEFFHKISSTNTTKEVIFEKLTDLYEKINKPDFIFINEIKEKT